MVNDPILWRLNRVEKRIEDIDQGGTRQIAVQKVELEAVKKDVEDLRDEVKRLRNALYVAAGSVLSGGALFALAVAQLT